MHKYKMEYNPLKYCGRQWGFSVASKPVRS